MNADGHPAGKPSYAAVSDQCNPGTGSGFFGDRRWKRQHRAGEVWIKLRLRLQGEIFRLLAQEWPVALSEGGEGRYSKWVWLWWRGRRGSAAAQSSGRQGREPGRDGLHQPARPRASPLPPRSAHFTKHGCYPEGLDANQGGYGKVERHRSSLASAILLVSVRSGARFRCRA